VNLEVTGVTEPAPANRYDIRDRIVLALLGTGFVASWTYVFMHPTDTAFGLAVGGTGAWSCGFHWLCQRDDKTPDAG